ncbi:6-carboxy-5,6,7,8-tetrahydropterin synthase [Porphyromonas macacae]|uniref:6-carboxy-5,6,7,8-tetrahydropterin synthase n=1 Tax=Porphyromonas macacae TaxID=28115 RepID=A0A379DJE6_9PORP|nr:6-carboxy-5,6,7,8-tetrahydropterin synthase [Porphyromonas macacae]
MIITAERYHDISMGHRVVGHEHKCRHLHGHNYRIHFSCTAAQLDDLGRIIDFSIIKEKLCIWLEDNWDHKMMIWEEDPMLPDLQKIAPDDLVIVPFNPTAEKIAQYLVEEIAPVQLKNTGVTLIECRVEETRKCAATYKL